MEYDSQDIHDTIRFNEYNKTLKYLDCELYILLMATFKDFIIENFRLN